MDDFGLLVAQYNSSLPTLTDGMLTELQVDVNGRLLVQADVTVLVDFLSLNGAGDSSNILIVGTEDGTSSGNAHAVRLTSNGSVVISDDGQSITVDASDLDIRDLAHATDSVKLGDGTTLYTGTTVSGDHGLDVNVINASIAVTDGGGSLTVDGTVAATQSGTWNIGTVASITGDVSIDDGGNSITVDAADLDIRDLSASQDNVAISDGTDTLAVNTDGSINVVTTMDVAGTEAFSVTDALAAAGDGLATITATATPWVTVASLAVGAGVTAHLFGYQWSCDDNAQVRIISDDTTDIKVYKTGLNSSAEPGFSEHFATQGRIEIVGAASLEVKMQIKKRKAAGGDANGTGSMHLRTF